MAHVRLKLQDHLERKGTEGAIEIELSDGSIVKITPPDLWPDEVLTGMADGTMSDVDLAAALMGTDDYKRFHDEGGTAAMVASLLKEHHGETLGK